MADAHGSGPCEGYLMRVQVSFPAAVNQLEISRWFSFKEKRKLRQLSERLWERLSSKNHKALKIGG